MRTGFLSTLSSKGPATHYPTTFGRRQKALKHFNRKVRFHDISTNRDIVISVDRFLELFLKHGKNVQIIDLMVAATAKYLIEFYDIPKERLHIVTLDVPLREGINKSADLPNAFDPTLKAHRSQAVFV